HLSSTQALRFFLRFRQVKERKDLVARSHSVHGDVEEGSQKAERNEKFRRQQDQHQRSVDAQASLHELGEGHDHPHGGSSVGDDIHHACGVQLHGEDLHCDPAEPLRLFVHLLRFLLIRAVNLQSGQSLQILKETVSQLRVDPPVLIQQCLRDLRHCRDRERDQRHADEEHKAGLPAHERQYDKQRHRRKQAVEKLREIFSEIGLQLFHSFCRHLNDL